MCPDEVIFAGDPEASGSAREEGATTTEECAWECVPGSFKFLSFVIRAEGGSPYPAVRYLTLAVIERLEEKRQEGARGRMICAGGRDPASSRRERREREQPGWRHGGTGSAKRDGNMRDTLRSPTVRLIRSGLPWNVVRSLARSPKCYARCIAPSSRLRRATVAVAATRITRAIRRDSTQGGGGPSVAVSGVR